MDCGDQSDTFTPTAKTQHRYKSTHDAFLKWQQINGTESFDEDTLLDYFKHASKTYKSATLMSMYSMLKRTMGLHNNVDITHYNRLLDYLKEIHKHSAHEKGPKGKIFSGEEINRFMVEAPDEHYLAMKAIMVFGVAGACRCEELQHVKIDHVKDCGTEIIVTAPRNRRTTPEMFLITGEFAKIVQKYMYRRPSKPSTDRFFLQYSQGECENQVIGRNKFALVPKEIAKFLKLDDYKSYTGHSFQPPNVNRRNRFNWKHATAMEANLQLYQSETVAPSGKPKRRSTATKSTNASKRVTESTEMSINGNLDMESVIIKSEFQDIEEPTPVDILHELTTSSNQHHITEVYTKPLMLPVTMSLMIRKSKFYMGLQPDQFSKLLTRLSCDRKLSMISDVMLMLTLRKLRLNENIEVLGDAFDLDRATAEQYYNESKHAVIDVADEVSSTEVANGTRTTDFATDAATVIIPKATSNHFTAVLEPIIKIEKTESIYAPDPIAVKVSDDSAASEMSDAEHDFEITVPPTSEDRGFLNHDLHQRTAECPLCHKFFAPRLLNSHMDSVHFKLGNLNRTICGLCFTECESKVSLKAHQKDAHRGGNHGCDICGKIFRSKRYIYIHILKKHAGVKTYLCDTCGEGFPTPYYLLDHNKKKHNQPGHACHLCDMKFMTAMWLRDHIVAKHTDDRPYKCLVQGCRKTFSWPSAFKSHARVHERDKFECSICSRSFSFKWNLRNHLKIVHNQVVDNKCLIIKS